MLGGALSGGVMAGGSLAINAYQNSEGFKDKQSGKDLANMKLTPDKYAAMVENGLNAPEGSEVRRTAEAIKVKLDAGKRISQAEYGKLWRHTNAAMDEAIRGDNAQRGAQSVPNASEGNYTTESANTALAKADEVSTGNAALDETLRAISEAGAVTNAQARTIMADRTMLDALSEITGIDLSSVGQPASSMTASEQRAAVKNAAIQAAETLNEQKNSAPEVEPLVSDRNMQRYRNEIDGVFDGSLPQNQFVKLGITPDVLVDHGAQKLVLTMTQDTARKIAYPGGYLGGRHNLGMSALKNLPYQINNPMAILSSKTQPNSFVILTDWIDTNGDGVITSADITEVYSIVLGN